jgi:hypothetical protein
MPIIFKVIKLTKKVQQQETLTETESTAHEFEFDEIRGEHGRKPKMALLNKTKLSKYEMDDLFTSEDVGAE